MPDAREDHATVSGPASQLALAGLLGDDAGRIAIGKQLETLRRLRNRVAHHDNLLEVDVRHRMNGMLSVLATIDDEYPSLAASKSTLRRLAREDPRRAW